VSVGKSSSRPSPPATTSPPWSGTRRTSPGRSPTSAPTWRPPTPPRSSQRSPEPTRSSPAWDPLELRRRDRLAGHQAIVQAMQATGVRRIVVVSASPVGTVASPGRPKPPKHDPGDGFFMRHLFSHVATAAFGKVYEDLALMEDVLRDSGLDWTALRPPRLNDRPMTGVYRTVYGQNVRGGWSVPRADVANYMLRVIEEPETIERIIGIAT
jgi:nucleoside-diphosphate-sugar epimerase